MLQGGHAGEQATQREVKQLQQSRSDEPGHPQQRGLPAGAHATSTPRLAGAPLAVQGHTLPAQLPHPRLANLRLQPATAPVPPGGSLDSPAAPSSPGLQRAIPSGSTDTDSPSGRSDTCVYLWLK